MVRRRRNASVAGTEKVIDDAEVGLGFSQIARSVKDFVASGKNKGRERNHTGRSKKKRLAMQ